jgi:hypothetical protein
MLTIGTTEGRNSEEFIPLFTGTTCDVRPGG